jgi:hypothetical protein
MPIEFHQFKDVAAEAKKQPPPKEQKERPDAEAAKREIADEGKEIGLRKKLLITKPFESNNGKWDAVPAQLVILDRNNERKIVKLGTTNGKDVGWAEWKDLETFNWNTRQAAMPAKDAREIVLYRNPGEPGRETVKTVKITEDALPVFPVLRRETRGDTTYAVVGPPFGAPVEGVVFPAMIKLGAPGRPQIGFLASSSELSTTAAQAQSFLTELNFRVEPGARTDIKQLAPIVLAMKKSVGRVLTGQFPAPGASGKDIDGALAKLYGNDAPRITGLSPEDLMRFSEKDFMAYLATVQERRDILQYITDHLKAASDKDREAAAAAYKLKGGTPRPISSISMSGAGDRIERHAFIPSVLLP